MLPDCVRKTPVRVLLKSFLIMPTNPTLGNGNGSGNGCVDGGGGSPIGLNKLNGLQAGK